MDTCARTAPAFSWDQDATPPRAESGTRTGSPRRAGAGARMTEQRPRSFGQTGAVDDPDAELVLKVASGDQSACRELVARHLKSTFGLARRMLGNDHDAEDVVQETFLRVWRHAPRWEPGRARFETWLYRV